MRRFGLSSMLVVGSILASLLMAGPALAAKPAIVSGDLESGTAKLPSSAKNGSAEVMAMNLDTGAYGDAANVGHGGHYSLSLPAGPWAIRTSAVSSEGYASFLSAAIVTKPGEHRSLPLTLRHFKKPGRHRRKHHKPRHHHRRRPRSASASNVNPRDGQPYPGTAYAIKEFEILSSEPGIGVFRKGMPDMLLTDMVAGGPCPLTMIEIEHRAEIEREFALQETGLFDPATRIEPGHQIDPEYFIRGRIEDRPGSPPRHAIVVWLEDAKTGARASEEVSVVSLRGGDYEAEQRLVKLIYADLICGGPTSQPAPGGETTPPPPKPKPVSDSYQGNFSGTADAGGGALHFEWSGNVRLDAAQDTSIPPTGAPPGEYRLYTVTSGSVHIALSGAAGKCTLSGSGDFELTPADGDLFVQLDVDEPAYSISIVDQLAILEARKTGAAECEEEFAFPAFGNLAETQHPHVASSTTLSDSESHTAAEGSGYDYTTHWDLGPG
jgi:hypothetical protein